MATQLHIFRAQSDTPAFTAEGGKLPNRVQIAKWGENKNTKGRPFVVGPKTLQVLPALQKARGFDKVALDYNHQSVKRPGHTVPEPLPVAAFGAVEVVDGEGIFLNIDTYTPSGLENAANYKDVSPAVEFDDEGNVIFVHSVGLCRQGSIEDLEFFSADFDAPPSAADQGKVETFAVSDEVVKALAEKLDLMKWRSDRAEQLDRQIADLQTENKALRLTVEELAKKVPAAAPEVFSADQATALVAKVETFATEVAALKDQAERRKIVDQALSEGRMRLFSVEDEATLPISTLRTAYQKSPRGVSLTRQTPAKIEAFKADDPAAASARAAKIKTRAEALQVADPKRAWRDCFAQAEREFPAT